MRWSAVTGSETCNGLTETLEGVGSDAANSVGAGA